MCGRYDLSRNAQALFRFFGVSPPGDWQPRYNVAPSQTVLTVHADEQGAPTARLALWGFKPEHAEASERAPAPINARAEKVANSAYFRSAFARRRAVVPADGWYEWRREDNGKQPYRFTRRDGGLLLLAGLWTPAAVAPGERLAIITEPARGVAGEVHPRMPLVLDDSCWRAWIDPLLRERDAIRESTTPLESRALTGYPVDRRVGNPRNDDASLIEPAGAPLVMD